MSNVSVSVTFDCIVDVVDPLRNGFEQTLIIDVSKCDPPERTVDKDEQKSDNGNRVGVTTHGAIRYGLIESLYITKDEKPYFREFFESVEKGEHFTLDVTLYGECLGFDTDLQLMNVYIPSGEFTMPRVEGTDTFQTSFRWQKVDE